MAMLSHWEVYAGSGDSISLATYYNSRATTNSKRNGKVAIAMNQRMAHYVKGFASLRRERMRETPRLDVPC